MAHQCVYARCLPNDGKIRGSAGSSSSGDRARLILFGDIFDARRSFIPVGSWSSFVWVVTHDWFDEWQLWCCDGAPSVTAQSLDSQHDPSKDDAMRHHIDPLIWFATIFDICFVSSVKCRCGRNCFRDDVNLSDISVNLYQFIPCLRLYRMSFSSPS